jgi:Phage integrase family
VLLAAGCHYSAVLGRGHRRTSSLTERDGPMTPKAFHALFGRIEARTKMPFPVHPHMLRHGCGYALANAGHDTRALQAYLGAQEHPAHGEVHRTGAGSVQEFLAWSVPYRAYRSAAKFEGLYGCLNVIRIAF